MMRKTVAGFIEEILSGRYPRIESLWRTEFGKLVDELLSSSQDEQTENAQRSATPYEGMKADMARLEALLADEKTRHEATKRELDVAKRERASLRYQVDAIRHALRNAAPNHQEPL